MSAQNGAQPAPQLQPIIAARGDDAISQRRSYVQLDRQKNKDSINLGKSYDDIDSTLPLAHAVCNRSPTGQQLSWTDVSDLVFIAILKRSQERKTMGVRVREKLDEGLEIESDTCYPDAKWTRETMVGEWNRYIVESKQHYKRIEKNDLILSVNDKNDFDEHGLTEMISELKFGNELRLVIRRLPKLPSIYNAGTQSSAPRRPLRNSIPEPEEIKMSTQNGFQPALQLQPLITAEVDDNIGQRLKFVPLGRQQNDGDSIRRDELYNDIGSTISLAHAVANGPSTVQQLSWTDASEFVFIAILKRSQERKKMGVRVREKVDEGLEIETETCYPDAKWTKETMVGEWNRYIVESKQHYKRIEKNDLIFSVNYKNDVAKQGLAEMIAELKIRHELRLVIRRSLNRRR